MNKEVDKMTLITWVNKKIKTYDVWDISALKTYCLLIGVVIGAYIPAFVKQYLTIFIVVIVVLMIRLFYKLFKK